MYIKVRRDCVTTVAGGKAVNITYSESVFVALVVQHALRMRHIVICGLSGPIQYFFHVVSSTARFLGEGGGGGVKVIEQKIC